MLDISQIGVLAAFARREGDNWFLAMVNGDPNNPKTVNDISLSFLSSGVYQATLVQDNLAVDEAFNTVKVPALTLSYDLDVTMRRGGGFVAMFTPVLLWTGATSGTWDINTTQNWNAWHAVELFGRSAVVLGNGVANRNITISGTVLPASVTVNNDLSNGYTIGGGTIAANDGPSQARPGHAHAHQQQHLHRRDADPRRHGDRDGLGQRRLAQRHRRLDERGVEPGARRRHAPLDRLDDGDDGPAVDLGRRRRHARFLAHGERGPDLQQHRRHGLRRQRGPHADAHGHGTESGSIKANTLAAVIGDAAVGQPTSLVKNGNNYWVLSGNNSYSGGTTINAGRLRPTTPPASDRARSRVADGGQAYLSLSGTVANSLHDRRPGDHRDDRRQSLQSGRLADPEQSQADRSDHPGGQCADHGPQQQRHPGGTDHGAVRAGAGRSRHLVDLAMA